MQTAANLLADELGEVSDWNNDPPPKFEEQDLDLLAFELWQQASCPESPVAEGWMSEEEALRCHASCL